MYFIIQSCIIIIVIIIINSVSFFCVHVVCLLVAHYLAFQYFAEEWHSFQEVHMRHMRIGPIHVVYSVVNYPYCCFIVHL